MSHYFLIIKQVMDHVGGVKFYSVEYIPKLVGKKTS